MTEIDERIVAMHFDNKQFEKGAKETIETLERLRESCDFEGSADALNGFVKSVREVDLGNLHTKASKLGEALKSIPSSLGKMALTPFNKLGSALSGLAKQVKFWFGVDIAHDIEQSVRGAVKALTVEPINAGWNEYEMKMDSIKTIMSGTAKEFANLSDEEHMGKVKETLEELNKYADDTIYSFKDMTANIGKFTNAGVKLDTAAKSMMGISNLAAKAGQGTQQASMAMYNFSQSMGLGYVELRDWRSIENANMATLEFKETLLDVGLAMGTLKKDTKGVIKTNVKGEKAVSVTAENLRETLNKKWLSSDVLQRTLEIYSGDLGEKELRAMGDFTDEQIANFLKIGSEAKEAATQVRTFSKMYDALKEAAQSGWAISFEKIIGDMNEATEFWSSINKRISGWMEESAKERNGILNQWRGMSKDGSFRFSEIDGRQELINSLNNIFDIVEKISGAINGAFKDVFGEFSGTTLADWSVKFREFTENMSNWLGTMDDSNSRISKLSKALRGPLSIIKAVIKVIKTVVEIATDLLMPLFDPFIDFLALIGETISSILSGNFNWETFVNGLKGLGIGILTAGETVWGKIKGWFGKLFKKKDNAVEKPIGEWFTSLKQTFNGWIEKIKDFIHWDTIKSAVTKTFEKIITFFAGEKAWNMQTHETVRKKSAFSKYIEEIAAGFNDKLEKFKSLIHWDQIKATVTDVFGKIKTWFIGEKGEDGSKVESKSGFQQVIDNIVEAVSSFMSTASGWSGWTVFGDFCTGIYNSIVEFCTPKGDGSPSALRTHFNDIVAKVAEFKNKVLAWKGWKVFGEFFTNNIIQPIIDFCTPQEEGSPSKLKETFDSIVGKVTEFKNTVLSWEGWDGIWDFFDKHIIEPFTKLWNWIFHGDANYSEKKTKAFSPIGVIASGMASDVPLLKAQEKDSKNIFESIASGLSESLQLIVDAFHIFSADEEGKFDPIGRFKEWAGSLGTNISNVWAPTGESIKAIAADISSCATTLQEAIDKIVTWIVETPWDQYFTDLNDKLRELGGTFAILNTGGLIGGLGKSARGLGSLGINLGKFFKAIGENGLKFDFGEMGKGIGTLATNLGETFKELGKNAGDFIKNPKELGKKVGSIFGGFREAQVTSTERVQTFANVLIEMAGAVGIMAWAITSLIDKVKEINELDVDGTTNKSEAVWERLDHLFVVIGSALGVTELFATINAFGKQKGASVASSLVGFAGAIAAMTWALNSLVELCKTSTPEQIAGADALLIEFAAIITAFNFLTNKSSEWLGTTDRNGFWKAGKTSAGGLIGFALAIEAMVLAVNQLVGTVKGDGLGKAEEAVLILTELSLLIGAFEVAKNWSEGFIGDKTAGTGLISFALAIEAMVLAVNQLVETSKHADPGAVDKAVSTLTALSLMIDAFEVVKNLTSGSFGKVSLGGGKTGLVGFAFAIEALVLAVKQLASLSKTQLDNGIKALGEISNFINSFVVLKDLSGLIGSDIAIGGFTYKGSNGKTGLLGFVAAITAMLIEVVAIGNLPPDSVQNGLSVMQEISNMVYSFQAIASLENITEHFGSVGQKVAATVSIGLFIAGLGAILWAIAELSKTTTPEQVQSFANILSELFPNLAVFEGFISAMALIPSGSGWLGGAKAALNILEFIAIFGAAAYGIAEWQKTDPELFETIEEGLTGIGKLIGLFTGTVQGTHQGAALVTLSSRLNDIETIDLGKLENMASAVDLVKKMSENLPTDPNILERWFLGKMSLSDFATNMAELGDGLKSFHNSISGTNFLGEVSPEEAINPENFKNAGIAIESLFAVMKDFKEYELDIGVIDRLGWFLKYLGETGSSFMEDESMLAQFAKLGEAFSSSWNSIQFTSDIDAAPFVESLALSIESQTTQERFKLALITSLQGAINSMGDIASSLAQKGSDAVSGVTQNMAQTVEEKAPEIAETAENWVNELLSTFIPDMSEAGKESSNELAEGAKTGASNMHNAGYYLDLGLANGIKDYAYLPENAMTEVTNLVYGASKRGFQFGSPSRLFEEVGKFNMQGLALGTSENEGLAVNAVKKMGEDYYLALQEALAPIDVLMSDNYSFSPVITPILDMTNLQNGSSILNGLFGNRYGLNASIPSFTRNTQVPDVQNAGVNNSQVIEAITSRMDMMSEELRNLKIVLNTGALVGNTVVEYDRALGRRASRAARG